MFRLRRMYFDSIGVEDNRFADLTIDLTDTEGNPTDSIVWLRNGAGKTTMLSLLLALIRPDWREFLAFRTQNRTIGDLILGGDTAHVVAEWVGPDGRLLLTGAVYEWDGRQRPADHNDKGKDRLRKTWWCLTPDDRLDNATLDTLPFTLRSNGFDRDKFVSHLSGLIANGADGRIINQSINQWHEALRERHFDPDLFDYFVKVNSAEGGIDKLFNRITSDKEFVRYLLSFVANPNQVRPVRDLLDKSSLELAKRPMYLAEKAFCDEAQGRVNALGIAHEERVLASQTLRDEDRRAAQYKRVLIDDAATALSRAEIAKSRVATLIEELGRIRSAIDTHRVRAAYYRMKAAELKSVDAESEWAKSKATAAAAKLTVNGWRALEHYLDLENRRTRLQIAEVALETRSKEARPLQEQLEKVRAFLAGAIAKAETQAQDELRNLEERRHAQLASEGAADSVIDETNLSLARLESEQENIHAAQREFEDARAGLIERKVISPDDTLTQAAQRLLSELNSAENEIARLTTEIKQIDESIAESEATLDSYRSEFTSTDVEAQRLQNRVSDITAAALVLSATPRLRILMETDDIDLGVEISDAIKAVQRARAGADRALVEVNEAMAAGERALNSLSTDGLLPPRLQVQKVIDELEAAGISAVSGWSYLAAHKDPALHSEIIAALPAVVDGVIVYSDDPAAAAAELRNPIDEAVVIAPARVFETDHPEPYLVVGPARAQHDRDAAATELTVREATRAHLSSRHQELQKAREDDDRLIAQLSAFQSSLPEQGLTALQTDLANAEKRRHSARQKLDTATGLKQKRQADRNKLTDDLRENSTRKIVAERDHGLVAGLAERQAQYIVPSLARLDQIPDEMERLKERRRKARTDRDAARQQLTDIKSESVRVQTRATELRAELEVLPPPQESETSVEAARTAVAEAQEHLRRRFPEETLLSQIEIAEKEVKAVADQWASNDKEWQVRALELASTSAAGSQASRRDAQQRADGEVDEANRAQGQARAAFEAATAELSIAQSTYETRASKTARIFEREEPVDQEHAQTLALEEDSKIVGLEAPRWELEQKKEAATSTQKAEEDRAGVLDGLANQLLRGIEAAEGPVELILPADESQIANVVNRIVDDREQALALLDTAQARVSELADDLAHWAASDKFVRLAEDENGLAVRTLRGLLRDKSMIERTDAGVLVADLEARSRRIADQIVQAEETKSNAASKLADLVVDALHSLAEASKLSTLPEGIGNWDHEQFIKVAPRGNAPTREQIFLRVGDLIDTTVNGGRIESDPVELLWKATDAAVPDGFKATILKPTPEQSRDRVPVSDMQKWSGGENLTASVMLFCVFARLRAEKRTTEKMPAIGGVLPLDNPIGKASLPAFLSLHRKVARATGVQLVYWTALGDLGAVTVFPRIVALRKLPSTRRPGRAYVAVETERSKTFSDQSSNQVQKLAAITSVRRES